MGTSTKHSMSAARRKLTTKQSAFVRHFLLLRDATKAARAAGYSLRAATTQGNELMQHPAVKREINKTLAKNNRQYERQLDAAMEQLFCCLTREATDYVDEKTGVLKPIHELSRRANLAVDGIEQDTFIDKGGNVHLKTKLKCVSKATAIDMALKIKGAYAPVKSEVEGKLILDTDALYERRVIPDPVEQRILEVEAKVIQ